MLEQFWVVYADLTDLIEQMKHVLVVLVELLHDLDAWGGLVDVEEWDGNVGDLELGRGLEALDQGA